MARRFGLSCCALIRGPGGRVLLIRRSQRSRHYAGKWEFPGGKLDPGEGIDDGLLREIREETGLSVSLEKLAGAVEFEANALQVVLLILEARAASEDVALSAEHDGHVWVPLPELPGMDLRDPLGEFLRDYLGKNL